jgi:hypothetical protein
MPFVRVSMAMAATCWCAILLVPLSVYLEQYGAASSGYAGDGAGGALVFALVPLTVVGMIVLWGALGGARAAVAAGVLVCGAWVLAAIWGVTRPGFMSGFMGAHGGSITPLSSRLLIVGAPALGLVAGCGRLASRSFERRLRGWWLAVGAAVAMTVGVAWVPRLTDDAAAASIRSGRGDMGRTAGRLLRSKRGEEQLWSLALDPSLPSRVRLSAMETLILSARARDPRLARASALLLDDPDPAIRGRFVATYREVDGLPFDDVAAHRHDPHAEVRALIALRLLDQNWPGSTDNLMELLQAWPSLQPALGERLRDCVLDKAVLYATADDRIAAQLAAMGEGDPGDPPCEVIHLGRFTFPDR